jgi:NADPH:quinone reductase-like Zn-dependent oxidoreductase
MIQAASLPETVFTAFVNLFEHGALKRGETLLIHAGTSGIGVTAIQMGKAAGARVIATVRGADKAAAVQALGADLVLDATAQDFGAAVKAAGGADVILDMVGGPYLAGNLDALNMRGRIVYIASLGGAELSVPVFALMRKQAVLTGSTLRPRSADEKARLAAAVEATVWPWIEHGKIKTVIDRAYRLEEAAQAHAFMDERHLGKVVLTAI